MRLIVLLGYLSFFVYLQVSRELSKYINMKYAYISLIGIILLSVLFLTHIHTLLKRKHHEDHHDCTHDHHHDHGKGKKSIITSIIYMIPILTGFSLPVQTLDASYAQNKNINIAATNTDDGTKISDFYKDYDDNSVVLSDKNFIIMSERIYNNIDTFEGKMIEYTGTVFKRQTGSGEKTFAVRFGIAHCVADSGVYGFMMELPEGIGLENDAWIHLKGEVVKVYDEELQSDTAIIQVSDIKETEEPEQPYVYYEWE